VGKVFASEHAKTAPAILAAVQSTISEYAATSVTTVGHSLGAALALLDSVYLLQHLPAGATYQIVGYGMPRVGNTAFANFVDQNLKLTHINNKKDFIPVLPPLVLGFVHPSGEVHITESGSWVSCSGRDNTDVQCSAGDVPNVFSGDLVDNLGPYNRIYMGCQ
jgi:predicted lipase